MQRDNSFDNAINWLTDKLRVPLQKVPEEIKNVAQEVRLRINAPVVINCPNSSYFVTNQGEVSNNLRCDFVMTDKNDIQEAFEKICDYSVYSHQEEIKNGYVTIKGGHRIGICGTAVIKDNKVISLRDISSMNVRVSRFIYGLSEEIKGELDKLEYGLLIVGPPSCGKTTLLKNIAEYLSSERPERARKVAVIDERGELSGNHYGYNNQLRFCDILNGYPKGEGIMQAVRSMSPEFIICDELGGIEDIISVEQGLNSGVYIIASMHGKSIEEIKQNNRFRILLQTGAFKKIMLLEGREKVGNIKGIYGVDEINVEGCRGDFVNNFRNNGRMFSIA